MNSPIKEIIQWFSRTFTKLSRKMAEAILTSLHNDTVDIDKLVDSLWIKLGLGKAFEEHVKQAIKKSYDIGWGEKTITLLPNLQNAWDSSGMNLSAKLHGADAEMREAIVSVITQQLKLNTHCLTAARALYDGYNADKVTRRQTIPKYLAKVVEFSRRADLTRLERETLQAKVRKTRRQVERLAQGGAPNKALKSAYMELLDACEHGTEKALNRAVHNACEEKSRYIAERIARTESARAWADGFVERYGNDEDVVAYRWKLSSRHPRFDICNLYAEANLWGLGKGIYPKDKTPNLPVHPHCLCYLAPVFSSELDKKPTDRMEAGGREYLNQLSHRDRMQLMGVEGARDFEKGADWRRFARNYSKNLLKGAEFKTNAIPAAAEAVIPRQKVFGYALNMEHPTGKHKAIVFESALGYNISNGDELIQEIHQKLKEVSAQQQSNEGYGDRYAVDMPITGPNGKTAVVRTAWIMRDGIPHLTTLYVLG